MSCGILGKGFAHLYCDTCGEHHVVAFSCKARAVCPSFLGRRMSEWTANLVDHVLPDVPIRQFVLTMPYPLRFPLREKPGRRIRYIRWSDLLRRVFGIKVVCGKCKSPLRLISLIKSEPIAKRILVDMHFVPSGPRA